MGANQPRRPAGTPSGGQWAPTAHDEADVDLLGDEPRGARSGSIGSAEGLVADGTGRAVDSRIAGWVEGFKAHVVPHKPFKRAAFRITTLADPDFARNKCEIVSAEFYLQVRMDLGGYPPERGVAMIDVFWKGSDVRHKCVLLGSTVVDWTARQFDPRAPWPLVEPLDEYLSRCEPDVRDFFEEKDLSVYRERWDACFGQEQAGGTLINADIGPI